LVPKAPFWRRRRPFQLSCSLHCTWSKFPRAGGLCPDQDSCWGSCYSWATMSNVMRPGDWNCPGCSDMQFARNAECRRCGQPKPGEGGEGGLASSGFGARATNNGQQMKEGDWLCDACGDLQFAKNRQCRKCGGPRTDGGGAMPMETGASNNQEMRDGDWSCPNCGDHVFAKNNNCRKCGTGRDGDMGAPPQSLRGNAQQMKDGDWMCPQCGDHVFARNAQCRQCGCRKPGGGGGNGCGGKGGGGKGGHGGGDMAQMQHQMMGMMQQMMQINPGMMKGMMNTVSGGGGGGKGGGGGGGGHLGNPTTKPGDWQCGSCGDMQFARNVVCRMCNAPKMEAEAPAAFSNNGQMTRDGDWNCPNCGDLQFARNQACRKCNTPNPTGGGGGGVRTFNAGGGGGRGLGPGVSGQDMRPGDWNCPSCGDLQFARNAACRRCGEAKPDEGDHSRSPRR